MKIVAVVPMKLNNRRLPQKNIKSFANGEPLCAYILRTLSQVTEIDNICVYCSNNNIREYLPSNILYVNRSENFDTDDTSMNDILFAFAKEIEADIYVMSHATAPFISNQSINEGLHAVMNRGYDSAFSVRVIQDFLWKDGKPFNYNMGKIPRTQDLEPIFMETSGFYIYKREVILNQHRRIGNKPYLVRVGAIEGIDIDEEEDFIIADAIFNYGLGRGK